MLNGKTYSVPASSLCKCLEETRDENTEIKGVIVEAIINLEEARPFPISCEMMSYSIFKYKLCPVIFVSNIYPVKFLILITKLNINLFVKLYVRNDLDLLKEFKGSNNTSFDVV